MPPYTDHRLPPSDLDLSRNISSLGDPLAPYSVTYSIYVGTLVSHVVISRRYFTSSFHIGSLSDLDQMARLDLVHLRKCFRVRPSSTLPREARLLRFRARPAFYASAHGPASTLPSVLNSLIAIKNTTRETYAAEYICIRRPCYKVSSSLSFPLLTYLSAVTDPSS